MGDARVECCGHGGGGMVNAFVDCWERKYRGAGWTGWLGVVGKGGRILE